MIRSPHTARNQPGSHDSPALHKAQEQLAQVRSRHQSSLLPAALQVQSMLQVSHTSSQNRETQHQQALRKSQKQQAMNATVSQMQAHLQMQGLSLLQMAIE